MKNRRILIVTVLSLGIIAFDLQAGLHSKRKQKKALAAQAQAAKATSAVQVHVDAAAKTEDKAKVQEVKPQEVQTAVAPVVATSATQASVPVPPAPQPLAVQVAPAVQQAPQPSTVQVTAPVPAPTPASVPVTSVAPIKEAQVPVASLQSQNVQSIVPPVEDTSEFLDEDLEDEQAEQEASSQEVEEPVSAQVSEAPIIKRDLAESTQYETQGGQAGEREFDAQAKRKEVEALVEKGIAYIKQHPLDKALSAFNHDMQFVKGELYLFVFDFKGVCFAHGEQTDLLWKNMYNTTGGYGVPFVQSMIEKARQGGGWLTYQWRNATKLSYVKEVIKDGKPYLVGCGYYPHSKADAVVNLVKGAVALFNDLKKQGTPKEEAFSTLSYPLGRFVFGDLYLYALDYSGTQVAHGDIPGLVGTNALNYRDAQGKQVNREIMAKLSQVPAGNGVWVDYVSKNAPKRAYAEQVTDNAGNRYYIACGYYPDADRQAAVNLVERGYTYMKQNGVAQAAREFTDKASAEFRYGDLYLFVYDLKGVCIAHGGNPALVGTNRYDVKDDDGNYYVRELINKAVATGEGGGWVDYKEKNAFKSTYVEKINIGSDYVIGCGVYPIAKREMMILVAKSASDYLRHHDALEALREFVKPDSKFMRGDIEVFVIDTSGICLAAGDDYNLIWKNLMEAKDDTGKPYIKFMINTIVKTKTGVITFKRHGATCVAYNELVEKEGKLYLVGSSFYL